MTAATKTPGDVGVDHRVVTAVLPDDLADAWPLAFERDAVLEDEQYDRLCDLEGWVSG